MNPKGHELRRLLDEEAPVVAPSVPNALSARIAEDKGFKALYLGGLVGAANLGFPDVVKTQTETLAAAEQIIEVCDLPLICDIENGFGELANLRRTVRQFDRAGVAAVQLDDELPKQASYHLHKDTPTYSQQEALDRVKCALDSRLSDSMAVIALTGIYRGTGSLPAAIDRLGLFVEAGADVVIATGLTTEEQLAALANGLPNARLWFPAGLEGNPETSVADLAKLGFALITYPYAILWAQIAATDAILDQLLAEGIAGYGPRIAEMRARVHHLLRIEDEPFK